VEIHNFQSQFEGGTIDCKREHNSDSKKSTQQIQSFDFDNAWCLDFDDIVLKKTKEFLTSNTPFRIMQAKSD